MNSKVLPQRKDPLDVITGASCGSGVCVMIRIQMQASVFRESMLSIARNSSLKADMGFVWYKSIGIGQADADALTAAPVVDCFDN